MKRLIASMSLLWLLLSFSLNPVPAGAEGKPTKSLLDAVLAGDVEQVQLNISAGANVNAKDAMGYTPLFYAAQSGRNEVAELLITGGANVNVKDRTGNTPLHYAAVGGHYEVCKLLLSRGANAGARNLMGGTPMAMAKAEGHQEIVELLSEYESGEFDIELAEPILRSELSKATESLFAAVYAGDANQVKLYISQGADVNAKNRQTWTPLHVALWDGHKAVAEQLIAKGAAVNAKDKRGYTPLHFAAIKGRTESAELLIAKGADVNVKNRAGQTPLHLAADYGHKDAIELLIAKGADINVQAGSENALSLARKKRHQEIVELLLKHGAKEPTLNLTEEQLYGLETDSLDLYPGYGGQLRRGGSRSVSPGNRVDILADANEIKARIKTFEGLEEALQQINSKSRLEKSAWLQSKMDNRTSVTRAVQEQVKLELTFVRKTAVEEKAEKTTKTIDEVLAKRQQLYSKIRRELLVQKRQMKQTQSFRGRSRGRYPSRSTRGRYPPGRYVPGQPGADDLAGPYAQREALLRRRYGSGSRGAMPRMGAGSQQQVDTETESKINEWLQTTIDNKANLLNSVHAEIWDEYVSIRTVAVEEQAKKTTAAIDGLLLSRQQRFDDLTWRMERARLGLPPGRDRYYPGQRYPQDRRLRGRIPGEHLRGQELYFLEEESRRLRR
ncbi:MAG: ankyrin repeat domain-containing protein [Sedimentisphaerales bacterium]